MEGIAGPLSQEGITPDDPGVLVEKFYFTPGDLGFESPSPSSLGKLGVLVCWISGILRPARLMALKVSDILPLTHGDWAGLMRMIWMEKERQKEAWDSNPARTRCC
jgi:N-carbamoylputrescine amidase